jgi:hypothetical protein
MVTVALAAVPVGAAPRWPIPDPTHHSSMTFTAVVRSFCLGAQCVVALALSACMGERAATPDPVPADPPAASSEAKERLMARVAIVFAEALARRDFDTAAKQLMGPEVCAEAPASQRAKCEREVRKNAALIRAELPNLAREFPPGFRVSNVSFEPLPGAGTLDGATVRLHPSAKDQTERSLMVGWIRDRAHVMLALPVPEREPDH